MILLARSPWVVAALCMTVACSGSDETEDAGGLIFPDASDVGIPDSGIDDTGVVVSDAGYDGGIVTGSYTWFRDVQPIIQTKCGLCHGVIPNFGAPEPLVDYGNMVRLNAFGQPYHELVAYRIVAPSGRMPPSSQTQLTAQEKEIIMVWSASGAPRGEEPVMEDSGVPEPDGGIYDGGDAGVPLPWGPSGDSRDAGMGQHWVNVFAHAPSDLTTAFNAQRNGNGTSYTCFSFTVPPSPSGMAESAVHFAPFVDQSQNVHHLFVYHDTSARDPDGPYDCLGTDSYGRIIGSWFPGRGPTTLPTGTGVPVVAGQRFTLEVHYDSVPTAGVNDRSGMSILLTDQQGLTPAGEVWAGLGWSERLTSDTGRVTLQGTMTVPANLSGATLFTATPHMHRKGVHISLEYAPAATPNTWRAVVDMDFDFANQTLFPITPPIVAMTGDQFRTTCTWTTANGPVVAGASSDNEMCYIFLYHYRAQLLPFTALVAPGIRQ